MCIKESNIVVVENIESRMHYHGAKAQANQDLIPPWPQQRDREVPQQTSYPPEMYGNPLHGSAG